MRYIDEEICQDKDGTGRHACCVCGVKTYYGNGCPSCNDVKVVTKEITRKLANTYK